MTKRFMDMNLRCSGCFIDLHCDNYFPKTLQCGDTCCKECVQNLDMHQKCPSCGKVLLPDPVDHLFVVKQKERDKPGREQEHEEQVRQLARGIAAGEELVAQLVKAVPAAVQALQQLLESATTQVGQLKQALEELRREEAGAGAAPELVPEQLEQAVRLVDGLRLMSIPKSSLVAVEEDGTVWKAFDELGPTGRLLLLQLRVDGRLEKADGSAEAGGVPRQDDDDATASRSAQTEGGAEPFSEAALDFKFPLAGVDFKTTLQDGGQSGAAMMEQDNHDRIDEGLKANVSPFVGPPGISALIIDEESDCVGELLKVKDILKSKRWLHTRSLQKLKGRGSDVLLRVLAPQLEELEVEGVASPSVMEEVAKMTRLKRLIVDCDSKVEVYPDLPLQLEELEISSPKENQLRCVDRMRGLRSLTVWDYLGASDVSFLPSPQHAGLVWLDVAFNEDHVPTMLSLIRAHAHSLRVLRVCCAAHELNHDGFYFPHLDKDLAAIGLPALEQLVLTRPKDNCDQVGDCLVQLRCFRESLGRRLTVVCELCP